MIKLIIGGARSGKSSFAEAQYEGKTDVVYIATSRVEDEEMKQRVMNHQNSRPGCWRTWEGTYELERAVGSEKYYLLDCITVLTSNIMFDLSGNLSEIDSKTKYLIEEKVTEVLSTLIAKINASSADLILVTNEVGCSIVPENPIARAYTDILGRVNQKLALSCDEVFALICGIPVKIK